MLWLRRPASPWGLAFFLFFIAVLWLLLGAQIGHAQTASPSGPPSLSSLLQECEENLSILVQHLIDQEQKVQTLRDNLRKAEASLAASRESLTDLQAQLGEAEQSLEKLQEDYKAMSNSRDELLNRSRQLGESWQDYRNEMQKQIAALQKERNKAKAFAWTFGVAAAVGFGLSIFMAVR